MQQQNPRHSTEQCTRGGPGPHVPPRPGQWVWGGRQWTVAFPGGRNNWTDCPASSCLDRRAGPRLYSWFSVSVPLRDQLAWVCRAVRPLRPEGANYFRNYCVVASLCSAFQAHRQVLSAAQSRRTATDGRRAAPCHARTTAVPPAYA